MKFFILFSDTKTFTTLFHQSMKETNAHPFPKFLREDHRLFRELHRRVNKAVDLQAGIGWVKFKAVVFPVLYMMLMLWVWGHPENTILFYGGYFVLGVFMVIIFLTVIHELSHDNIFKTKKLNRFLMYFFDLMGANSFIWKKRHELMHHNYPNIKGWDSDIEQSNMFKIFPDAHTTWFHKKQHRLVFLFYPFYLLNWLLVRDFRDFFSKNRIIKKTITIPAVEFLKLFVFKSTYFFYMLVVPVMWFHIPIVSVLIGFLVLNFTASVFALGVLLPPHAAVQNDFPDIDENLQVSETWLSHQLKTTSDITWSNWFTGFFMGHFNYHVAHHLFPNISYLYMPQVTQVIKDFAREHHLPYKQLGMGLALVNHWKLLKQNAIHDNVFEETF